MAFFDSIGQRISQTGQNTIQKTKELAEIARINSLISGQEKQLEGYFTQLGRLYYAQNAATEDDVYADLLKTIRAAEQRIGEYKQQIRDLKGVVLCDKCGAEVIVGARFCSSCGAPMPVGEPQTPPMGKHCTKCGALIADGASFCTSCGTPVSEQETPAAEGFAEENSPSVEDV